MDDEHYNPAAVIVYIFGTYLLLGIALGAWWLWRS